MREPDLTGILIRGLNSLDDLLLLLLLLFHAEAVGFGDSQSRPGCVERIGLRVCRMVGAGLRSAPLFYCTEAGFSTMVAPRRRTTSSPKAHIAVMLVAVVGMCFMVNLEALISEGETPAGLQHMVGIYNIVWAGTGAVAYFIGGAMLIDWASKVFYFLQPSSGNSASRSGWLEGKKRHAHAAAEVRPSDTLSLDGEGRQLNSTHARRRPNLPHGMAGNQFAYIAINTLVAVMLEWHSDWAFDDAGGLLLFDRCLPARRAVGLWH